MDMPSSNIIWQYILPLSPWMYFLFPPPEPDSEYVTKVNVTHIYCYFNHQIYWLTAQSKERSKVNCHFFFFFFQDLPDHEKEVYQEMAHQAKSNKKFQPARYDRMDCTGQLISVRTCSRYLYPLRDGSRNSRNAIPIYSQIHSEYITKASFVLLQICN